MTGHYENKSRRPWVYERYGPPSSLDPYWSRFFEAFLEHKEKALYLLVGLTLVRVKFEGAEGSDYYARLTCTVTEVDGTPIPSERLASAMFEARERPTPEQQQAVLRSALEKCGIPFAAMTMVSDKYVEGHLKRVRLEQRIMASQKGGH